jgi:hypothetical protein
MVDTRFARAPCLGTGLRSRLAEAVSRVILLGDRQSNSERQGHWSGGRGSRPYDKGAFDASGDEDILACGQRGQLM